MEEIIDKDLSYDKNRKKNKISSPPNEYIISNSYHENSFETNYKKISFDSSSLFSSSFDNDSSAELDPFMNSFRSKRV